MAPPRNFQTGDRYTAITTDLNEKLNLLNLEEPEQANFKDGTISESLSVATHINQEAIREICRVVTALVPEGETSHPDLPEDILTNGSTTKAKLTEHITKIAERTAISARAIQCNLHKEKDKQLGKINLENATINPIPKFEGQRKQEVNDSCLKLLDTFSGEGNSADNLEKFLQKVFDIAKTGNLSEKCVQEILFRKCEKTARVLLEDLKEQNEVLTLKHTILYMEQVFAADCQPSLARSRLEKVTKGNTESYHTLLARIIKLSYLASLDQPENQRESYKAREAVNAYLRALQNSDRSLILKANEDRLASAQAPLSNQQMAQYLLNHHAQRKAHNTAAAEGTSMSMRCAAPTTNLPEQFKVAQQQPQRNFPQRARSNRFGPGNRQGQQRGYQQNEYQTNAHRAPPQRGWQQRPRANFSQRGRSQQRPRGQANKEYKIPYVTCEMAGVAKNACLKCSSPSHYMGSKNCVYANKELAPSGCRACSKGAHWNKDCLGDRVNNYNHKTEGKPQSRPYTRGGRSFSRGRTNTRRPPPDRGGKPQSYKRQSDYDKVCRLLDDK